MNIDILDYYFPFIVFAYGLFYILVSESKIFLAKGKEVLGSYHPTFLSHKPLAWICLFVGGLWALQNIYFLD